MVRALSMFRLVPLAAAAALALAGCKSECRQLAEVLCTCSLNSVDNTNCLTAAGQQLDEFLEEARASGGSRETLVEAFVCLEAIEGARESSARGGEAVSLAREEVST